MIAKCPLRVLLEKKNLINLSFVLYLESNFYICLEFSSYIPISARRHQKGLVTQPLFQRYTFYMIASLSLRDHSNITFAKQNGWVGLQKCLCLLTWWVGGWVSVARCMRNQKNIANKEFECKSTTFFRLMKWKIGILKITTKDSTCSKIHWI